MRIFLCLLFILIGFCGFGQVSVTIVDESDTTLPFVEIFSEDYEFTALSNADGKVEIPSVLSDEKVIVFKFLGYQQEERTVASLKSSSLVILKEGLVLEEITMIGRTDNQSRELAGKVESIDAKVFQLTNPQTSADALGQYADVFIQKSQMGGGSPIIRGFEANKVLLVLDGVRMNNAIYRSGHLQNAITVDQAILERLEVLYGPGSLIYGSDAIGGVVHFRSRNPKLNFDDSKTVNYFLNAYTRYASANHEQSCHVDINLGSRFFGSLTSVTIAKYGDLRTGNRRSDKYPNFGKRSIYVDRIAGRDTLLVNEKPNVQIGTGYQQMDYLQKFVYRPSDELRLLANVQYSTSSNVPRYDALSERAGNGLKYAEWYYGPQNRFFSSVRADYNKDALFTDKVILIAAYQKIDEDRIDRRFGSDNQDRNNEDVKVYSLTADLHKYLTEDESFELNYGAEFNYNDLESTAFRTKVSNGVISKNILTRYPSGGSTTKNLAAYLLAKKIFSKWNLFGGLRYSVNEMKVQYNRTDGLPWPESYYEGVTAQNRATSWSLGATTHDIQGWKLSTQVSSAFRSPNIDDLAKIRVKSTEISVPNLDLKPEISLNGEVTINKQVTKHTKVGLTGFATLLKDAIIRADYRLSNGQNFLIDEGDTLYTVANINEEKARVQGVSFNMQTSISHRFAVDVSFNYVRGVSINKDDQENPLAHIPPVYGKVGGSYDDGQHKISMRILFNGEKPVTLYGGSADNIENATPDGTPAWYTINAYYQRILTDHLSVSLGIENIFDTHYRPFASGVSAAGRNVIVTLRGNL